MKSRTFTVTTTATKIVAAEPSNRVATIHVVGSGVVYLGGSDVTTANGLPNEKNAIPIQVEIPANEELYGIVSTSTEEVRVLVQSD